MQKLQYSEPLKTILITGANGFLAGHLINIFLEKNYFIIGTVKNLKDLSKTKPILEINSRFNINLLLKEINLMDPLQKWENLLKGVDFVIHCASPHPKKGEKKLIEQAVCGVENVFNAAIKNKVKKIVLTSSHTSLFCGRIEKDTFTEKDFGKDNKLCPEWEKSKLLAEIRAWEIYEMNKDKIDLCVICPGFIFGPSYSDKFPITTEIIARAMRNDIPGNKNTKSVIIYLGIPTICFSCVDVRDVAIAHFLALENENSKGKRYVVNNKNCLWEEIISYLKNEFSKYNYKLPTKKIGRCPFTFVAVFDREIQMILPYIGRKIKIDNSLCTEELKLEYRNIEETFIDVGYSLINWKIVPNKLKGDA